VVIGNHSLSASERATFWGVSTTPDATIDALARIVFGGVALTSVALDHATDGRDLTFTQWWAIVIVGESDEGCRVSEVARRTNATVQATSHLLRRLEGRGFISLTRDERDRRATLARLTPSGARFRAAVLAHRRRLLANLANGIEPSAGADEFLQKLARRMQTYQR
jgi:DNA-binding MarR family transcriptional regulator